MPNIQRSKMALQPLWREIPKLEHLNLTQTPKSVVTCRVCRGQRIVAIESNVFHSYTFKKCLLCKGSGVMSNNEGTYERS